MRGYAVVSQSVTKVMRSNINKQLWREVAFSETLLSSSLTMSWCLLQAPPGRLSPQ